MPSTLLSLSRPLKIDFIKFFDANIFFRRRACTRRRLAATKQVFRMRSSLGSMSEILLLSAYIYFLFVSVRRSGSRVSRKRNIKIRKFYLSRRFFVLARESDHSTCFSNTQRKNTANLGWIYKKINSYLSLQIFSRRKKNKIIVRRSQLIRDLAAKLLRLRRRQR